MLGLVAMEGLIRGSAGALPVAAEAIQEKNSFRRGDSTPRIFQCPTQSNTYSLFTTNSA